ncbi:uncharacterized protein MELLADRAFT_96013 [Melampsora larici-populina 98AG31]|uniref:Uncharacterized protein n=1 Tax=Melampsora larici-populina (strain 98AG31 / pathotype 3-4-7) TaxID=747676 RepID=F4SAL2_MELLP|nr:uncharacterized protein MELLADRAFT_96013 [Melampsora larici-populina 98AG31]EGF98316.1 hypothetical protein MELLADRAFT_96013 [Melampsora larici-populina 98AG31]
MIRQKIYFCDHQDQDQYKDISMKNESHEENQFATDLNSNSKSNFDCMQSMMIVIPCPLESKQ